MSSEILFSLMQGGNATTLSTRAKQIESKLLDIIGIVVGDL
jgi:hypothetical protein